MEKFKSLDNEQDDSNLLNKDFDDYDVTNGKHWVERLAQIKPDFSKIQD